MISNAYIEKKLLQVMFETLSNTLLQICINFWRRVANQLPNCENPQNGEKFTDETWS